MHSACSVFRIWVDQSSSTVGRRISQASSRARRPLGVSTAYEPLRSSSQVSLLMSPCFSMRSTSRVSPDREKRTLSARSAIRSF